MTARALEREGRFDEALAIVGSDAEAARSGGDPALALRLTLWEARLAGFVGDPELALARATWAISEATKPGNPEKLGKSGELFSVIMSFIRWVRSARRIDTIPASESLRVLDIGERFVRAASKPEWLWGIMLERAYTLSDLERYDEAIELWREGLDLKQRVGEGPGMATCSAWAAFGRCLDAAGQGEEAASIYRDLLEKPDLGVLDRLASYSYLGHNALERGENLEAVRCAKGAILAADKMTPRQQSIAHGLAVEAYLAVGELELALESAEFVLKYSEAQGETVSLCCAYQDMFDVCFASGDLEKAALYVGLGEELAPLADARTGTSYRQEIFAIRRKKLEWVGNPEQA